MVRFKLQVSADYVSLVLLLNKLGFSCGPMKAGGMTNEGRIDLWFVPGTGTAPIKRVTAILKRGEKTTVMDSPRRVYEFIVIRFADGSKGYVEDQDFTDHGLETPREYGFYPERPDCSDCA
jgi:hypothetical protein